MMTHYVVEKFGLFWKIVCKPGNFSSGLYDTRELAQREADKYNATMVKYE